MRDPTAHKLTGFASILPVMPSGKTGVDRVDVSTQVQLVATSLKSVTYATLE